MKRRTIDEHDTTFSLDIERKGYQGSHRPDEMRPEAPDEPAADVPRPPDQTGDTELPDPNASGSSHS